MPANRSRTDRWRQVLQQIHDRNGGLEFTIDQGQQGDSQEPAPDLVWRVRITQITDDAIFIEPPAAVGRTMQLVHGTPVVCVMAVGQNRWMFKSKIVAQGAAATPSSPAHRVLKIEMPTEVERCIRRNFYRVTAAEINLPKVQVYPLRDITSAVPAEHANAVLIKGLQQGVGGGIPGEDSLLRQLPDVGTPFTARLMNVGGGGVGLIIDRADATALEQARVFWLQLDLQPQIPAPIGLTARLAHTHIDSEQNTYAGMAFEFAHHPQHREFVVHQFTKYVDSVQSNLKQRKAA